MTKQIIGAGGGGGSQQVVQNITVQQSAAPAARQPRRDPDNLASTAYASLLDLLGEGEIEGFPSAKEYVRGSENYNKALLKDVYLNNTPVLRSGADISDLSDSDYNYTGVTVKARYGTNSQAYIDGFDSVEDIKSVNVEVKKDISVTRQITDTNVDAVRVTIAIPRLERATDEGDVLGSKVQLKIDVQYNGGGFTEAKDVSISGRTADKYERDYIVDLDGAFPVDIRVRRISPDSSDQNVRPSFFVSYTEIIYEKLSYPNSALVAVKFNAEQFSSIPSRQYKVRGIKVALPNNATVDQETGRVTYSGTWTGTFGSAQWCSDPAWILWDLLTTSRYGFGDHIAANQLDKFAFYSASQYCNELVDAGLGDGTKEARFSCNALIQNQYEAYKLINDLCSVMRTQPYWSTGALTITQDKPTDSTYLFNRSNVLEPGFTYLGSDLKTRHTVAVVAYLDLNTRELNYEVVEDRDAIEKYGVITTEVKAFACTSRGQANRLGQWLLYTEQQETEVISFTASVEAGTLVRPGSVIDVNDPVRAGVRYGGRIVKAGDNSVTVDSYTNLPSDDATLSVLLPDGTLETRNVISRNDAIISVDEDWTTNPQPNSVWILQTDSIQTQQYRVLSVAEKEGHLYEISGLKYNSSKYDHIERGYALQTRSITALNAAPLAPSNLTATEKFYASNDQAKVKIVLSWQAIKGIPQYRVRYREENGNWETAVVTKVDYEILDTKALTYSFEVYAINALGRQSALPTELTFNAVGKTAIPADVQNLRFEVTSDKEGTLKWDESTEIDVKNGGKVYIRHSSATDGSGSWSNSVDLIEAVPGSSTSAKIPLLEGEVLAKFADDGGRLSANATSVIIDLPDALGKLLVEDRREDQDSPPFQGDKVDTLYSSDFDALILDGDAEFDDVADVDNMANFDTYGSIESSGSYTFTSVLDLEAVYSLDLKRHFVTRGFFPSDAIDSRGDNVDSWDDWDGDTVDKVNAKLLVRRTDDDPDGASPTWTSYTEFANGTFKGRAFQFKTELTSSDTAQNIKVDELGYVAEFQRRTEQSDGAVSSGAGAKTITFGNAFFSGTAALLGSNAALPSIGITGQNMQSGDYFEVTSVSRTGFTVTFKNSSGTAVSRNFNWSATGYGKAG